MVNGPRAPRAGAGARDASRRAARLAALACVGLATAACGGGAPDASANDSGEAKDAELVIFAYDRSTSIADHHLENARALSGNRLAHLTHGDRIAALEILQLSLEEPVKRWSQGVPEREWTQREIARDSVSRARFLRDARVYLRTFSDTTDRTDYRGTDLLSTLHHVGEEVRASPEHRPTLYLFSDMLQATREINMEGARRMPTADWVERAAGQGTLPDLEGLCVVVAGARTDTPLYQRVKEFWTDYFEATGAVLLDRNYSLKPVRLSENPCAGAA